jgi:hypothetical protein
VERWLRGLARALAFGDAHAVAVVGDECAGFEIVAVGVQEFAGAIGESGR